MAWHHDAPVSVLMDQCAGTSEDSAHGSVMSEITYVCMKTSLQTQKHHRPCRTQELRL